ncbi:hepatic and glial cell adhesion molecule-like [Rhinoraja longicauda]
MKTFDCSFLCLLQLLSQRVSAQWTSDSKLAATGSSVSFPGTDKKFNNLHWDFSDSSRVLHITDVLEGNLIIYEKYKNRIKVNISNGSFQLKDVRKSDSGHYNMMVDLDPQRTRILNLEIIDPPSTPSISSEYNPETHMAVLNCTVQRGRATSILWIREGVVLPVTPWQSLSDGNVTFTIWNAEGSDSGYYTCSVENQVSRTNHLPADHQWFAASARFHYLPESPPRQITQPGTPPRDDAGQDPAPRGRRPRSSPPR